MYHIMDQLLEEGVIEPSSSAWSSPVVMHLKPDGTRRPCIDFRKINELTKKDAYPLPNMNEILSKLRNPRYISTLDLSVKNTPHLQYRAAECINSRDYFLD